MEDTINNITQSPSADVSQDVSNWDTYGFNVMNGSGASFLSYFSAIGQYSQAETQYTYYDNGATPDEDKVRREVSYDEMRTEWINYGNSVSEKFREYDLSKYFNDFKGLSGESAAAFFASIPDFITSIGSVLGNGDFWKDTGRNALLILQSAASAVGLGASQAVNIISTGRLDSALASAERMVSDFYGSSIEFTEGLASTLDSVAEMMGNDSVVMSVIGKGISIFSDGGLKKYQDGITETSFGYYMENTWKANSSKSFYSLKKKGIIKLADTTPFDAGENLVSLYGNMLLGVPPLFNNIVDPKNRAMAQTIIRDAKFLTLTPGLPKYNGSIMLQATGNDAYHQTVTPESMLAYLTKNGLDESFANKDRRYYTFQTDYKEYYSYLETMLNTMWIKMGLSASSATTHTIFTFFTDLASDQLKPQYKTSFGFFVNPQGILTENVSNTQTTFGSSFKSEVDSASETYQQINYMTGMGTGGALRDAMAMTAKVTGVTRNVLAWLQETASNTIGVWTAGGSILKRALYTIPAVLKDTQRFITEKENGVTMQSFATTNGMKVQYPELWSDSTYSRSINVNFEFISPYGDPLSIFQYVLAPFAALFCYACPRQAAENGYVSPFFVRADIPGYFTSDLAIISDFTFTRGGNNDLWTKDGLPRAISGSFTIQDLYPYLAMTKRISFLSANPNYTVFLNSLTGLHAINTGESNDALNAYWQKLLNNVNGLSTETSVWNRYSQNSTLSHNNYTSRSRPNRLGGNTKNNVSSTWLRGIK